MCYGSKAAFTCALEAFGADHLVTGSDYPVLQDYEEYKETFAYIERLGLAKADTDELEAIAAASGWRTIRAAADEAVADGRTTAAEVVRVLGPAK